MSKGENMTSSNGNRIANQFIITDNGGILGNFISRRTFQSYNSIIAVVTRWPNNTRVELDERYWDYSKTTGKYRNLFLGEDKKETQRKIDAGIYKLVNLNK